MTLMLERIRRIARGESPPPPVAALIGFSLTAVEPGAATLELDVEARHHNPMGTLHGGILCDLADAAMGMAYATMLEEGETFTTLNLHMSFLKPIFTGHIVARGRVTKPGRMVGLVEAEIVDDKGKLVAKASSTCMILRGAEAGGRQGMLGA